MISAYRMLPIPVISLSSLDLVLKKLIIFLTIKSTNLVQSDTVLKKRSSKVEADFWENCYSLKSFHAQIYKYEYVAAKH